VRNQQHHEPAGAAATWGPLLALAHCPQVPKTCPFCGETSIPSNEHAAYRAHENCWANHYFTHTARGGLRNGRLEDRPGVCA
jgi:hypothetical protein